MLTPTELREAAAVMIEQSLPYYKVFRDFEYLNPCTGKLSPCGTVKGSK